MPWIDLPRYLPKGLAEYTEDWLNHPNRRPWGFAEIHKEVEVPNLDFTGWYDHCNETIGHLTGMQKHGRTEIARTKTKLIIGPWNHKGLGKRKNGDVDFGAQAELDLTDVIIRWFDYWLKGLDNGVDREPVVRYFVMSTSKSMGRWKSTKTWPPKGMLETVYYLSSKGDATNSGLLTLKPPQETTCDMYTYDPNDPVPTLWTPDLFTVPSDRRLLEYRMDILYYRTPHLKEDIEVVGYPEVFLYASSSAPDTDFFARLVDEDPLGPALEVCYGMVRTRHRNGLNHEEFLIPDEVTRFRIKLGPTACRFLSGHRIRLEITSSDFPNHDRNHNTGRNDLTDTELVIAQQKILHSPKYPSQLVINVDANTHQET
jgi:hypothetical protein